MEDYLQINEIGKSVSPRGATVGDVVQQKTTTESRIRCGWTDGLVGCGEDFRHSSEEKPSFREVLDMAAEAGWLVVCRVPVCPFHREDDDGSPIDDIDRMQAYFGEKG